MLGLESRTPCLRVVGRLMKKYGVCTWNKAFLSTLLGACNIINLQYISKLTEKAVFQQTHSHMAINSLYPELQSSYRQHHGTETALLKVMNDVLLNMNSQQATLMVLLDLSAAFDTVNYDILLKMSLECAVLRSTGFVHIFLIDANKSLLMDLCLINAILTVVYLRGPV